VRKTPRHQQDIETRQKNKRTRTIVTDHEKMSGGLREQKKCQLSEEIGEKFNGVLQIIKRAPVPSLKKRVRKNEGGGGGGVRIEVDGLKRRGDNRMSTQGRLKFLNHEVVRKANGVNWGQEKKKKLYLGRTRTRSL